MDRKKLLIIGGLVLLVGLLVWNARRQSTAQVDPLGRPVGDVNSEPIEAQLGALQESNSQPNTLPETAAQQGYTKDDMLAIRQGLAASFEMEVEQIEITIERDSTPQYATGYVNVGEGDQGGIYFAAKTGDGWQIAHNGTGILTCPQADAYDFPTGLIPRCFDPGTGTNIDR